MLEKWKPEGENCPEVPRKETRMRPWDTGGGWSVLPNSSGGAPAGAASQETGCKEVQPIPSTLLIDPSYFFSVAWIIF